MAKSQLVALTVHRPWGWAIANTEKRIENRPHACLLPVGTFIAIHQGRKWEKDAVDFISDRTFLQLPEPAEDPECAIVAIAKFGGVVTESHDPWFVGPFGWVLDEVVAIDPVSCPGQQGFWYPKPPILAEVRLNYKKALESIEF